MTGLLASLNADMPDATAIAQAVSGGELSAAEVLRRAGEAAESAREINAFVTEDWDRAEAIAASIDRRRSNGEPLGPLAGVPMSVKDVIAVAGIRATGCSVAFAGNIATVTAPAVARLLEADAVVVGKTNCPEFAFGTTCTSPLLGTTLNPRYPEVSVGGSSGGEAAALAAGVSALGVGTDFGGSLRWPAQCAGIAALRPTAGSLSAHGQLPGSSGDMGHNVDAEPSGMQGKLQTIGPMARSLRDLGLAWSVMSGQPAPQSGEVASARVGWADGSQFGPVRGEVSTLLQSVADWLTERGHSVRHAPELFAECLPAYNRLRKVDPMVDHEAAVRGREGDISQANLDVITSSFSAAPAERRVAAEAAAAMQREALGVFSDCEIIILPVAGGPACDLEGTLDIDGRRLGGWQLMGQCRAVTLTGAPVVSLPVGLAQSGLPLSVQIVAAPGQEYRALAFAAMLDAFVA